MIPTLDPSMTAVIEATGYPSLSSVPLPDSDRTAIIQRDKSAKE